MQKTTQRGIKLDREYKIFIQHNKIFHINSTTAKFYCKKKNDFECFLIIPKNRFILFFFINDLLFCKDVCTFDAFLYERAFQTSFAPHISFLVTFCFTIAVCDCNFAADAIHCKKFV
ncbi:hypothetical protein KFK09_007232 [Dendrobium nobile]|uniref:Uncharacterized protein n=1 Tax=Dendrobium nobile TaxID=94219 RepID=A0A8T3BVW0_DENNO|nr:hypothetical protein KFK09_007232 [Dendrobium nobile]